MKRKELIAVAVVTPVLAITWLSLFGIVETTFGQHASRIVVAALLPGAGAVIWIVSGAPIRSTFLWIVPIFLLLYLAFDAGPVLSQLALLFAAVVVVIMVFSERAASAWINATRGRRLR